MASPVITRIRPQDGATDVLTGEDLVFQISDADGFADIDLANTVVRVREKLDTGGWDVWKTMYTGGAFQIGYNGSVVNDGVNTVTWTGIASSGWDNSDVMEIDVATQDFTPNVVTDSWQFQIVPGFYVTELRQLDLYTLLVTFSNQVGTIEQNDKAEALTVANKWQWLPALIAGYVPGFSVPDDISLVTVKSLSKGTRLMPNQLLVYTTRMAPGEAYSITPGGADPTTPLATPDANVVLKDIYGQGLDVFQTYSDGPWPPTLIMQWLKTDSWRARYMDMGYDVSPGSVTAGVIGAIGFSDDELGGSGKTRVATGGGSLAELAAVVGP